MGRLFRVVMVRAASKIGASIRGYVSRRRLSRGGIDPLYRAVVPWLIYVRGRRSCAWKRWACGGINTVVVALLFS